MAEITRDKLLELEKNLSVQLDNIIAQANQTKGALEIIKHLLEVDAEVEPEPEAEPEDGA